MGFKVRLREAIAGTGLSDGGVADRLTEAGYDATHDKVRRWRNGRSLPDIDDLPTVAAALRVDPVWLATGRLDVGTLTPDETVQLTVARSLRLPLDEAIRRLSTPAAAPHHPQPATDDPPRYLGGVDLTEFTRRRVAAERAADREGEGPER